jgi:hypothetical protein
MVKPIEGGIVASFHLGILLQGKLDGNFAYHAHVSQ